MAEESILRITLAIIIGTLAAIVYSLRILVLLERRVSRMEGHIGQIAVKILREEQKIEKKLRIGTTTKKTRKTNTKSKTKSKTRRKRRR